MSVSHRPRVRQPPDLNMVDKQDFSGFLKKVSLRPNQHKVLSPFSFLVRGDLFTCKWVKRSVRVFFVVCT